MKVQFNKERIKLYLQFGGIYLLFWLIIDLNSNPDTFMKRVVNNVWLVSYLTMLNYFLFEFSFPFIRLRWTRLLAAPFLLFAYLMLFSFGLYAWRSIGIKTGIYFELIVHESVLKGVEYIMPYSILSAFAIGILKYTYDFRKLKETAQLLRIEKQQAELNFLKSQTNPHFLFNTLNNIYSLSRDKSDLAPESIMRLSKILRFMLYDAGGPFIAIEQEIKVIQDYIALEQLRYDDSLQVRFHCDVEDESQAVPPLLLIPLVENAFKHGAAETLKQPNVDISLVVKNKKLNFEVRNTVELSAEIPIVKENIGLSNLRRQLELLYREYSLEARQEGCEFVSKLNIQLTSNA